MSFELLLSPEKYKEALINVTSTPDGLKLIGHLIAEDIDCASGFQGNSRDVYNKGKSEHSLKLLEDIRIFAFDKFLELMQVDNSIRVSSEEKAKKKEKERKEEEDDD